MKNHYVQAVIEMLETGAELDSVLAGLSKTLQVKGHTRLHASILRGVLRVLDTDSSGVVTQVIVASEADLKKYAEAIKTALEQLGADTDFKSVVDDSLIGGFVAEHNNTIINNSHKAKLLTLYRSIAK